MPPFSPPPTIPASAPSRSAFITHIGKYLPGEPIANDEMEQYLGRVGDRPSRVKNRILKSNGIQQRYYALDRQQQTTISNSQMAAAAVRDALAQAQLNPRAIDLLACGTTWQIGRASCRERV